MSETYKTWKHKFKKGYIAKQETENSKVDIIDEINDNNIVDQVSIKVIQGYIRDWEEIKK